MNIYSKKEKIQGKYQNITFLLILYSFQILIIIF